MDRLDFSQGIENALNSGLPAGKKKEIRPELRRTRSGAKPGESRRSVFSDILENSTLEMQNLGPLPSTTPSEEAIEVLLDEVRSSADSLKRRPLPQEMLEYKKAVRNFLHYVVNNSYEIELAHGKKKKWDSKVIEYSYVRIIDQKLEELAAGILLKQINELQLKNKLEEITGLLVDLTITGKINER